MTLLHEIATATVEASAYCRHDFAPEPICAEPARGPRPRRRPTEGERTKARSRGKAARKARRAGR